MKIFLHARVIYIHMCMYVYIYVKHTPLAPLGAVVQTRLTRPDQSGSPGIVLDSQGAGYHACHCLHGGCHQPP